MSGAMLPTEFADLEPLAAKWSLPTEHERYATRLSSSMEEMQTFYDACFPRAESAMQYLDQFALDEIPDDAVAVDDDDRGGADLAVRDVDPSVGAKDDGTAHGFPLLTLREDRRRRLGFRRLLDAGNAGVAHGFGSSTRSR